ncbi:MAG TPA: response regulator transcription factor [Actinomycetota bacterium]|nr:response regulator transcription factor [Actinomycetota bacterium]
MPSISHPETADILTVPSTEGSDPDPVRRVVLIDSRPERRAVMGVLVDQCPGLIMVGVAADLDGAATRIREQRADVAIVEIQMPVAEGLATIGALREQFPHLRIVVCSFHDDAATRQAAEVHGADAYLRKPLSARDLFALTVDPHAPLVGSTTP